MTNVGAVSVKSVQSEIRSFIKYINTTQRTVAVEWVDYNGIACNFRVLQPQEFCLINTYVTHPWRFRDNETGEQMHVRGQPVYMPDPWFNNFDANGKPTRKEVRIHFPLRTLRDNCLWRITELVPGENALRELEIPRILVDELLNLRENILATRRSWV
ncbi:protein Vhl [Anopheles aquasalis]|uniref:protein Vhl n=1 Tax=Anopheles aquasalis TaxID=42839 RepID=UPI00215A499D|nr:protein Vhl [Anopheles aquasalis]